jgi:hypothetical protein
LFGLVSTLVAAIKFRFEEQGLVAGTEQSRLAGRLTRRVDLPALFNACY